MKEYNGGISFYFDSDRGLSIVLEDSNAHVDIVKILVKPADIAHLFANRANVDCRFSVSNIEKIGKYHKHKKLEFPLSKDYSYQDAKEFAIKEVVKFLPKNYEADNYFSSQDSFFEKDGKPWARCTIRKWSKKKPKRKKITI